MTIRVILDMGNWNNDAKGCKFEIELTHCDEMDRVDEFKKQFATVNIYDSAFV